MATPYAAHRAQLEAILKAWGMPAKNAELTAEVMAWADLHGIDSHGISMVTEYDDRRRKGRLNMQAEPKLGRETPVSALVDGDGGLGHVPARLGMATAIAKAKASGMAVVAARNSAHFGACGFYTTMAAEAGLIGMAATSAAGIRVVPTGGAAAKFGTDPWSFAAPSADGQHFVLDMATTTVAAGKVRNKANESLPCPPGWVLTKDGAPTTDPLELFQRGGFLTPLGGTPEGSSHKGYGLAAMVNILTACLAGSTLITDPMHMKQPFGQDIGHFFLALDPGLFRDGNKFQTDVAAFSGALRATTPADPAKPVQVAGDPERSAAARRMRDGIPVGKNLLARVRAIAEESGAPWLLD